MCNEILKVEKRYDFLKEISEVHKKDRRDFAEVCKKDEFELKNGICIVLPEEENEIIYTAAKDFADYLLTSMKIGAMISKKAPESVQKIELSLSDNLGDANGYMGYSITTSEDGIKVEGYDARGVMQGLFFMEDLMNLRKGPFMKIGNIKRKALFDLRMVQSPLGMYNYTDEALAIIAHYGYDSIDIWLNDAYTTHRGDYIDMRGLCARAEKYGIRINIELFKVHAMHPDEPGAQEYYDKMYGELFEACPKIGSIILEGEANHFVSKDPNACIESSVDNIPTGKYTSGWWPCTDYPQFAEMVLRSVRKYSSDTEILFSTYNWGFAPEKDRISLIENLPDGISLIATWDMFHNFRNTNSVSNIPDYSLRFIGPGEYFQSEAIACKKRGMKLRSITNTAGKTWDFGVIPYEPAPTRWTERFKRLVKANKEWDVSGIQECIHYGFYPSIVSDLGKWSFFTEIKPIEEVYDELLKRDYGENADEVKMAFEYISEAIANYPISDGDQYGAFRTGPAYPLWLNGNKGSMPPAEYAMFKNIFIVPYTPYITPRDSLPGVRLPEEMEELKTMIVHLEKCIEILKSTNSSNIKLHKLANMAEYMKNTCITVYNVKELYLLRNKMNFENDRDKLDEIIDGMKAILLREKENVENTIPVVRKDSIIGWEPSMEYVGDEKALRWKLRQLDFDINYTINNFKTANSLVDIYTNKE